MTTELYRDQVEKLREKLEKVKLEEVEEFASEKNPLPTRSEIHHLKRKKKKGKVKFPLLKSLLLFFILLPVIIFSAYTYFSNKSTKAITTPKGTSEEISYDIAAPIKVKKDASTNDSNAMDDGENNNIQEKQSELTTQKGNQEELEGKDVTQNGIANTNDVAQNQQTTSNDEKIIYHTVQPKETLFSIAMQYYQSKDGIETIKKWNQINNNEILVGQVLKIHLPN